MAQKEINEQINIIENISCRIESGYLISSNEEKIKNILASSDLSTGNIIDIFISLHIVLEVSLNTLHRHLILNSFKKRVDKFDVMKNIDNISFIDKTTLFIYNSKFAFGDKLSQAEKYHGIISKLKDFSGIRNQLLHGHSICSISERGSSKDSELKKKLNREYLDKQIKNFKFILEGMRFYLDCLESSFTKSGKEDLKKIYLNDEFLI